MKNLIWEGKELTVKEASLLIWGDLAKTGRRKCDSEYYLLLRDLDGGCPYCEFYNSQCRNCILFKGIKNCNDYNSLFDKWAHSESESRQYWAQKIYNRILKMPDLLPGENPPEDRN